MAIIASLVVFGGASDSIGDPITPITPITLDTSDLKMIDLETNTYVEATAVAGPFEWANASSINPSDFNEIFMLGGSDFVYLDKTGDASAAAFGYTFIVSAENKPAGQFTLSWDGQPLPTNFDLVFALKSGQEVYPLYFFDDFYLANAPKNTTGQFEVTFNFNKKGVPQDLSFMAVYGRPGAPIPEPGTMLLFGTGLAGLAAVGRRRKN